MKNHRIINALSKQWVSLGLIALIGALIYSNIYRAPFVFDDGHQIVENVKIRDLGRCLSPTQLFSQRPVAELTFALNYRFGGLDVFGYHLVNVLIHILNGFLVYFLALIIFERLLIRPVQPRGHSNGHRNIEPGNMGAVTSEGFVSGFQSTIDRPSPIIRMMSLFAALIFIAHPVQTQAVTYIIQRHASLAAAFYLLSIFFYLRARILQQGGRGSGSREGDRGQWSGGGQAHVGKKVFSFRLSAYFALAFLCGVLAFLSKQNAASLPGAVLLVEYLLFDRTWQGWKRKLRWLIPMIVLMGIFILYVSGIFRGGVRFGSLLEDVSGILQAPGTRVDRWVYFCTQLNVIGIYIRLLFLPVGQNLDYMYPFKTGFFDGFTPAAFLLLLALAGIGVWQIKRRPVISFGIFWFFITLSIESSFFPIKDALFEHRLYLPMFGFAMVIAYILFWLLAVHRYWLFAVSAVIILSLGTATYLRNQVWQNAISLWSDAVDKNPKNYRAQINLGYALRREGRLEEAVSHYRQAIDIMPNFLPAHNNIGVALAQQGKLEDAFFHFSEALRIKPGDSETLTNFGQARMQEGKIEEAVLYFHRALKSSPTNAKAHNNLGIAMAQQGKLEDAAAHFSKALRTEPYNARIHRNMGLVFMLQGDLKGAARHFSEAVRINPEYAEAHCKLAIILMRQGDVNGGIRHFSKALDIQPDLKEARQGLSQALQFQKLKKPQYR